MAFNTVGPLSPNITYNSDNYTFTINSAGVYTIEYDVKATSENYEFSPFTAITVQVMVNGTPQVMTYVPGLASIGIEQGLTYAEASNQITLTLAAGTTIQLQAAVTPLEETPQVFYGVPGSPTVQEAAYLSIEKIG